MVRRALVSVLALLVAPACARNIQLRDVTLHNLIPSDGCLVIGFMGGRDSWNDDSKGVRQLALTLRSDGMFVETFENRSRDVAVKVVRRAMFRADSRPRLVVYGQSFGGAAVVKFARDLRPLGVRIALTVQVDSVGRGDRIIPPNVDSAANLYQDNGWFLDGEHPIVAEDSEATQILGNWRFDYSTPPGSEISLHGLPFWKILFRIPHARMDRDPAVWSHVQALILAACETTPRHAPVL